MAATGWRVIDKCGGSFDFKSGKPEKDKEDAKQLKKELGDDATMTPLGGPDAYEDEDQCVDSPLGGECVPIPEVTEVLEGDGSTL